MWPTPRPDPFDAADFLFEPTWGGHRALAFVGPSDRVGGGEVAARGPGRARLIARLPELAGIAVRLAARSAVLDGELVVVDAHGRADDDALRAGSTATPAGRSRTWCSTCSISTVAGSSTSRSTPSGGAATGAPPGRRGGRGPGDQRRGPRAPRGGVCAGDRRGARPSPLESRTCPACEARCGGRSRRRRVGPGCATEAARGAEDEPGPVARAGTAPVLALFRRLPFPEDPTRSRDRRLSLTAHGADRRRPRAARPSSTGSGNTAPKAKNRIIAATPAGGISKPSSARHAAQPVAVFRDGHRILRAGPAGSGTATIAPSRSPRIAWWPQADTMRALRPAMPAAATMASVGPPATPTATHHVSVARIARSRVRPGESIASVTTNSGSATQLAASRL